MTFGEKWRRLPASYWDDMAERCTTMPINAALTTEVLQRSSVIEIGCGAGHFAETLIAAGFSGSYWACDFSIDAVRAAGVRLGNAVSVYRGRFENLSRAGKVGMAEIVFSRNVVQHQPNWLPFAQVSLRHAPVVMFGVSRDIYFKETGEHDVRDRKSFFDVRLSLEAMDREATAAGLRCAFTRLDGDRGPEVVIKVTRC